MGRETKQGGYFEVVLYPLVYTLCLEAKDKYEPWKCKAAFLASILLLQKTKGRIGAEA